MSSEQIIGLVPMRHHSQRVPGKNFRLIGGRPLYAYILECLLEAGVLARIVVDTDSPVIRDGIRRLFPAVTLTDRPEQLRGGDVPMNRVLLHDVGLFPAPFYLQTHSTNPLLTPATVRAAVRAFLDNYPRHDSLVSVTRWQKRLWDAVGNPINHDPRQLLNTQDLPPLFEENSCIYLFEREAFVQRENRIGERPMLFEMEANEALDIDDEQDCAFVEAILASVRPRAE
jgi:CMP-N-acetylneuraminic acid synthetase